MGEVGGSGFSVVGNVCVVALAGKEEERGDGEGGA